MAKKSTGQSKLEQHMPCKVLKKMKGYYLPEEQIDQIKATADDMNTSENLVLTGMISFYYANCEGDD